MSDQHNMNNQAIFSRLVKIFGKILNSQKGGKPSDERLVDAHILGTKFFEHALSIVDLSNGIDISQIIEKPGIIEPFSSISILVRAIFENYLLFFYIFIDTNDADEFEFRYCTWKLTGLTLAEDHLIAFPYPAEIQGISKSVQEHIDRNKELRKRIKATNEYKVHKRDSQDRALKGQFRPPPWIEIAGKAGLGPKYTRTVYQILTSHDHSGGLATIQIQSYSSKKRTETMITIINIALSIIAIMIEAYIKVFPETKAILDSDPEIEKIVHIYAGAIKIIP